MRQKNRQPSIIYRYADEGVGKVTNVLIAIDGPNSGKILIDFVTNHNWVPATNFKLIHVVQPPRAIDAWPEYRFDHSALNAADTLLSELAIRIKQSVSDAKAFYDVRIGNPTEEILKDAGSWPADLILVSSHERNAAERFLLGSVSLSVLMNAHCTVTLVRVPGLDSKTLVGEPAKHAVS
jgi:nucleotide-binding universal stress UspA family protein